MRFTRRFTRVFRVRWICLVSISLVFRTLFAKDASIQIGISLLLVLQHALPKFVDDLDYTVPNIHNPYSIKIITEKYNTAMYMIWRWQFVKIIVRWIFSEANDGFMNDLWWLHDGFMIFHGGFVMASWLLNLFQKPTMVSNSSSSLFLIRTSSSLSLLILCCSILPSKGEI